MTLIATRYSNVLTTGAFYKSKNLEDALVAFFEDRILIDTMEDYDLRVCLSSSSFFSLFFFLSFFSFTFVYFCFLCLLLFTFVYFCLLLFTFVFFLFFFIFLWSHSYSLSLC